MWNLRLYDKGFAGLLLWKVRSRRLVITQDLYRLWLLRRQDIRQRVTPSLSPCRWWSSSRARTKPSPSTRPSRRASTTCGRCRPSSSTSAPSSCATRTPRWSCASKRSSTSKVRRRWAFSQIGPEHSGEQSPAPLAPVNMSNPDSFICFIQRLILIWTKKEQKEKSFLVDSSQKSHQELNVVLLESRPPIRFTISW